MPDFRSFQNTQPKAKYKRELKTLAECWEEFSRRVIPPGAGERELARAKMVFYSGAAFLMDQNLAIGEPHVTEDEGEAHLKSLSRELEAFTADLALDILQTISGISKQKH